MCIRDRYCSATGVVRVAKRHLAATDAPSSLRSIENLTCKDVFDAGKAGDAMALEILEKVYEYLGRFLANVCVVVDPEIVVLGGGLSGASKIFMPKVVELLNTAYPGLDGNKIPRMEISAYNLDDEEGQKAFTATSGKMIKVPFSDKEVWYDPSKKIGITATKLGTSSAVCIGAYAFAMNQ